ncbi:MAG: glycoside hydrolase family 2 TIM barrel-domain containing protein [Candidatus Krumholzibacteriia bacterium]
MQLEFRWRLLATVLTLALVAMEAAAQAVPVEVIQTAAGGWQLLRGGEPYLVKGAGGSGSAERLAAAGGTTLRTWGVGPDAGDLLDRAQALGLTVIVGHWLGHERHGFDYHAVDQVAEQFARVRRDVLAYKDHPALLLWGVGNEMEGFGDGDDAAVWSHVEAVAAMIKSLDPDHPTMTVTADIGGRRVDAVHRLCPDIDILGINSYGGMPSLPRRYRAAGGTKPYLVTEFGPPGTWEVALTSFGAPLELTSTEKAAVYRDAYERGYLGSGGLCLGALAFTWGFKMEGTSTWYGMFLPDGDKLAAVDAMTELWSGQPPADRCPEIRGFGLRGADVVAPGDTVRVDLEIVDPEGTEVSVAWTIRGEADEYATGGDAQAVPLALDGIIVEATPAGATLVMPGGGVYRLYVVASDGHGGGATANVPLQVDGPAGPLRLKLPVAVYADGQPAPWAPSGWMGTYDEVGMDDRCTESPRSGATCLRFTYSHPGMWAGVAWQHPANDWGDQPGGFDLTGARKLTFWARGAEGNERIDFGVGLLTSGKPYHDTVQVQKKGVKLSKEWKRYTIDLGGEDLSRIKTPFVWTAAGQGREITFDLDDIRFE